MNGIQRHLILIFCVTEALVIGLFGLVLAGELGREYARLEEQQAADLLRQVRETFEVELSGLGHSATDWGCWDALYAYLETRDPLFLQANIPDDVLDNLELDALSLLDPAGQPVVSRIRPSCATAMEDLLALIRTDGPLAPPGAAAPARAGMVVAGGRPMLAAAHAVTSSDGTAPARGILLMVREVSMYERIRSAPMRSVRLVVNPGPELSWLMDQAERSYGFYPVDRDRAQAGLLWPDVTGQQQTALVVSLERTLHRQYLATLGRLWLGLALTSLSALLIFLWFLKRNLLNRVLRLQQEVGSSDQTATALSAVTVNGRDEISALQESINNLLRRLETSREELLRERQIFDTVVAAARDAILLMDDGGRVLFANPAVEPLLGWRPAELIGQDLHTTLAPERYHDQIREGMAEFRRTGEGLAINQTLELIARRKDGTEVPMEVSLSALQIDGRWHAVGIVRDITARKRGEALVRQSEELMRSVMENLNYGVLLIDRDFRVVMANPTARAAMVEEDGEFCYQLFNAEAAGQLCPECPVQQCFEDGRPHELRRPIKYRDGTVQVYRLRTHPVRNGEGSPVDLVIELIENITELEQQEQETRQHQRLEAVGRLAAGIAHEINTPIQYVGDNLEFLAEAIAAFRGRIEGGERAGGPEDEEIAFFLEEAPRSVAQAQEGVNRVAGIVRAMKAFSHPGTGEKTLSNINQDLLNTVTISRNEWKYVADLNTALDEELPPVPCYPAELNQMYLNLIVNAAHAIADRVERDKGEKGLITVSTRWEGPWAEIRISDTGTGIPVAVRDHIFDPFFTTKEVGRGTGQGLTIARDVVVNKHRGTITFETEEGKGTTFIIRLPLEDAQAPSGPPKEGNGEESA